MFLLTVEHGISDARKADTFIAAPMLGQRLIFDKIMICLIAFISARPGVRDYALRAYYDLVLHPPLLKKPSGSHQTDIILVINDSEYKFTVKRRPCCETLSFQAESENADVAFQPGVHIMELFESSEFFVSAGNIDEAVDRDPILMADKIGGSSIL